MILHRSGPQYLAGEDAETEIQCGQQQQHLLPEIWKHQKKGKSKQREKQGSSHSNRRKKQAKVKQLLLSPLRQFDKLFEGRRKNTADRRPPPPFAYDGEDLAGHEFISI